jgi:uncharacterized RDD family membrane protein YckC
MTPGSDRVGKLLNETRRERRTITSPEGVEIGVDLAARGERLAAFAIDMTFMTAAVVILFLIAVLIFLARVDPYIGLTVTLFLSFLVRCAYFIHFELAWQGLTPGKKICGLRVIDRAGGPLRPSSIIARNLTREVEIFLPLSIFLSAGGAGGWGRLASLGWACAITSLPLLNKDNLRAGDLIGGTMVIWLPKRELRKDLGEEREKKRDGYSFTSEQLAIYGAFELQVLEDLLRRAPSRETDALMSEVCAKIRKKIGWMDSVAPGEARRFLDDFYRAERGVLERGQLFGRFREDKNSPGGANT